MSIPRYQTGERVRLIVEGPVVHHALCESPYPSELTVAVPMNGGTYQVTVPLVDAVTIERLTPDVLPREIWEDRDGDPWFAICVLGFDTPRTMMLPGELHDLRAVGDSMLSPEDVDRRYGPITRVYPPAPAPGTGGQAEQPAAPRVMVNDRWKDGDGEIWWGATNAFGEPGLTLGDRLCTWGEVDGAYGPLTLIERGGYCPTEDVVLAARLKPGMVVSHPDWVGGAPVRVRAVRAYETATYELLGDRAISGRQVLPGATLTIWDEIAGGAR